MALSSNGKLAITGYYNEPNPNRSDEVAGLWTADLVNGSITNLHAHPLPSNRGHGISDIQWLPDGQSVIYRETMPRNRQGTEREL